ncbi:MAG: sensor histidine kinase [Flavobacteriales bacterium]
MVLDFNYNVVEKNISWHAKKIIKINDSYYASHHYDSEELDSNFNAITEFKSHFKDIIVYNDTIFVATYNGLFYRDKNEFLKHPVNFTKPINSLIISKNKLLIGTDGHGLYQYINGKTTKIFKNISFIEKLRVYNDTAIFAATNKGLFSISNRDSTFNLNYIYNINDGLKSNLVNDAVLLNDYLFIATAKGISKIGKEIKNLNQLQSIHLNKIIWNESVLENESLRIKYTRNNSLEIDFSAINFTIKNYLNFSYKLNPTQRNFTKIPKGQVNLNNLPIGKYELILRVEDEKNNSLNKSISIEILPNWYQTTLFYVLLGILLILGVLYLLKNFRNRISMKANKEIEQEKQLSNFKLEALRSQMNPHFVFNSLNAIQYYMNENDLEMSDKYLLKFSRLIRQFFDLSNVTEISLNKEIELISNYLEIEKMRFIDKLDYEVYVSQDLKKSKFDIPTMILQPIVENAVNHGVFHKKKGGKVTVNFDKLSDNSYTVIIQDDGIGIENSKIIKENSIQGHDSKSTVIFKERIALLNKSSNWKVDYNINNLSENIEFPGTEVTLIFTQHDNSNTN